MARKKKLDFSDIATDRKKASLNQKDFWSRYGVTQSGGSQAAGDSALVAPIREDRRQGSQRCAEVVPAGDEGAKTRRLPTSWRWLASWTGARPDARLLGTGTRRRQAANEDAESTDQVDSAQSYGGL